MHRARARMPIALALTTLAATGCVERVIKVTSDPPGARVWLNDQEIGTTPAEAAFTFHGVYDVRLELDGHQPISEPRNAKAPLYQLPFIDLVAEALPVNLTDEHEWHFNLEPVTTAASVDEADAELISRAEEMRAQATDSTEQQNPQD